MADVLAHRPRPVVYTSHLAASVAKPLIEMALLAVTLERGGGTAYQEFLALLLPIVEGAVAVLKNAKLAHPKAAHVNAKIATRALRIAQGYEGEARQRALEMLIAAVEGQQAADGLPPLCAEADDRQRVILHEALHQSFAAYVNFLECHAGRR